MGTISLCMIVRDEQELISQCLSSVSRLVDEIVIVDTGSIDRTIEIAKSFGARVYQRPWDNDFAAARNLSLEMASKDWILVLDADEALDLKTCQQIKDFLKQKKECYLLTQRHYTDDFKTAGFVACKGEFPDFEKKYLGYFETGVTRLFPNHPQIRFTFPIHELVEPSIYALNKYNILDKKTLIHHYGHAPEQKKLKDEFKRNLYRKLGEEKIIANPNAAKPYFELGVLLLESSKSTDIEDAVGYLSKAAELNGQSPETLMNLGYALMQLGKYEESGIVLTEAVQKDPSFVDAWINLSALFKKVKNFTDAERCLLKAYYFDHEKNKPHILINLGLLQIESGKLNEAKESLSKAVEIIPNSFDALKGLAVLYYKQADYEKAWQLMQKAATLGVKPIETHYYLACVLRGLGKASEALRELQDAKQAAKDEFDKGCIDSLLIQAIDREYELLKKSCGV